MKTVFSGLRTRVFLPLALLLALSLAGGGFTAWYAISIKNIFAQSEAARQPVESALRLQSALASERGHATYYLLDGDESWLNRLNERVQEFERWLDEARRHADSAEARALVNQIDSAHLRSIEARRQAVGLFREGRRDDAIALLVKNRGEYASISSACEQLADLYKAGMDASRTGILERVEALTTAAAALTPLVMLLGGALSLILVSQILRPLRELAIDEDPAAAGATPWPLNEVEALERRLRSLRQSRDETISQLEESRERVMQQEKLAMVGKLAAGVAHSVRNPLTSVKMRLFALNRTLQLDEHQREDFEVISDEIRHIDAIVQNFLEFSRPPKLRKQTASPSDVVDMALLLMRHRLDGYRIEVRVEREERLPPMMLDVEQFKEALVNHLVNACEAMPGGGQMTIREEYGNLRPLGDVAVIRLTDSGPGVPPELVEEVFQPFFSTKEEGSGLGLAISRRVAEEHGGRLIVTSGEGRGASFTYTLPYGRQGSAMEHMRAHFAQVGGGE